VHECVARDQSGPVRGGDRVECEARPHARRHRVSDQFFAAQIQDAREAEPALARGEAADIPDGFQPGHRRGEPPTDQIRNHRRALIRFRQVPALTPGDPGDPLLAHQPREPAAAGTWSRRAAVTSWLRPGRAAEIQINRPRSSVRARKYRP
jgi:hypothetical protein